MQTNQQDHQCRKPNTQLDIRAKLQPTLVVVETAAAAVAETLGGGGKVPSATAAAAERVAIS